MEPTLAAAMADSGLPSPDGFQGGPLDAASLTIDHGGNKGGRARSDGLVPGSPEAREADREKDRERKRAARARRRPGVGSADAPPLPSKLDAAQAPDAAPAAVPWDAGQLAPLFEQMVPAVERWDVSGLVDKARKVPGMPPDLLKEIEKDAAWNPVAKASLVAAGAQVAVKWLNRTGLGAENAPEVVLATALASIVVGRSILVSKLDDMAKQSVPAKAAPKPDSSPGAAHG